MRLVDARRVGARHIPSSRGLASRSSLSICAARHRVTVYDGARLRSVDIPASAPSTSRSPPRHRGASALVSGDVEKLLSLCGAHVHDGRAPGSAGPRAAAARVIHSVSRLLLTACSSTCQATGSVRIRCQCLRAIDSPINAHVRGACGRRTSPSSIDRCDGVDSSVRRAILEATSGRAARSRALLKELSIPRPRAAGFALSRMRPPSGARDYMLNRLPNWMGLYVTLFSARGRDWARHLTDEVRPCLFETRFPDASALMPHLAA